MVDETDNKPDDCVFCHPGVVPRVKDDGLMLPWSL